MVPFSGSIFVWQRVSEDPACRKLSLQVRLLVIAADDYSSAMGCLQQQLPRVKGDSDPLIRILTHPYSAAQGASTNFFASSSSDLPTVVTSSKLQLGVQCLFRGIDSLFHDPFVASRTAESFGRACVKMTR